MKKIVLFLIAVISLISCNVEDDGPIYNYEILPIASYVLPANFTVGKTYEIKMKYQKPSSCHIYKGIYYEKDLNTRKIAVQVAIEKDQQCTKEVPPISETTIKFVADNNGSYIFKFYKGKDATGKEIFEDVEVPVVL
jgi:hypothetical protein